MTQLIQGKKEWDDERGVEIIKNAFSDILKEKDHVVFAIPGGRSVQGILSRLADDEDFPWHKIHIFMVDERLVPIDHKDSNYLQAKELFIDELIAKGKLQRQNVHPFILNTEVDDYGISQYEKELKKYGGRYDIVLLGAGEDGHIAALYPIHHSIKDDSEYFITMEDSPKPPPKRMSLSRNLLLRSKIALILFYGEGKKRAYENFNDPSLGVDSCPAKLVKEIDRSYVLTNL